MLGAYLPFAAAPIAIADAPPDDGYARFARFAAASCAPNAASEVAAPATVAQASGSLGSGQPTPSPRPFVPAPVPGSTALPPAPAATNAGTDSDAGGGGIAAPGAVGAGTTGTVPSAGATPAIPAVPRGPGVLIPPTPQPAGSAGVTPPPLPTSTPSVAPTGPVFLIRNPGTPPPIPVAGASPTPQPSPGVVGPGSPTGLAPQGAPTLAPDQIAVLADRLSGSTKDGVPADAVGNVHVYYGEGQLTGDRAHYDGNHTIVVSGNAYLINRRQDTILYADRISFDTFWRQATIYGGHGATSEGVETGRLYYTAQTLNTTTGGVTHGRTASFTTCENPRSGYHINAKSIDVTPGDKFVARHATVFLGALAVFYLPVIVIPLRSHGEGRRTPAFVPELGYSQSQGVYEKSKIGFGSSDLYYGYYRLDYFSKEGLGLGYVAYIARRDGKRTSSIDSYTINNRTQGSRQTNINATDNENFSRRLRAQLGATYQSDYGPLVKLPPTENIQGALTRSGDRSSQNLTFSRYLQGTLSNDLNLGFTDSAQIGANAQQQVNLSYTKFNSSLSTQNTLHINTLTHLGTKAADYNFTIDKTDYSSNPFGYDRLPELQVTPHVDFGKFKYPFTTQFTIGDYTEQQNHFTTSRTQAELNWPFFFKLFRTSDFSANFNAVQDYYGTGDEKAQITQQAALNTPFGPHIVNSITYNEQNPIGPADVPFQLLDRLAPGSHQAQDVLRIYNRDIYSLSLTDSTFFNRTGQPLQYQLAVRPSRRATVLLGGAYIPGPGNGFSQTNVQIATPFGRDAFLEFTTNVDWKNKGRLLSKNIYYKRTFGSCYDVLVSYNQDLKQFNVGFDLLAFPDRSANFGFSRQTAIVPQAFAF